MSEDAPQVPRSWPPHKDAYRMLTEMGLVAYGCTVTWAQLEPLFGIKREVSASTRFSPFLAAWLELKQLYEGDGFLLTERGMNGEGFRVLERQEMAEAVKVRELRKADDSLRKSLVLSQVPRDGLKHDEVKKLDHWEAMTAIVGASAKWFLRRRSLPSPESTASSLSNILKSKAAPTDTP